MEIDRRGLHQLDDPFDEERPIRPRISPGKTSLTDSLAAVMPLAILRREVAHTPSAPAIQRRARSVPDPRASFVESLGLDLDNPPVVQAKGSLPGDVQSIHQTAAEGVSGAGNPLPHLDRIQRSFGHHDVGNVRAHIGAAATTASDTLSAEAYAFGQDVAFRGEPDLHLAAHEAAHVVQQRAGVSLKGGVGEVGDVYERHADAVADKVVAGESAEALLDQMAGGGTSGGAVQQKALQRNPDGESADVDPERDRQIAAIESTRQATLNGMDNQALIELARRLDPEVMSGRHMGPRTRAARARTLIRIYEILNARNTAMPTGRDGTAESGPGPYSQSGEDRDRLPPGDDNDPLGGLVDAIPPFGNLDAWHTIAAGAPRDQPQRRRGGRGSSPSPGPTPEPTSDPARPSPTPRVTDGDVDGMDVSPDAVGNPAGDVLDRTGTVLDVIGMFTGAFVFEIAGAILSPLINATSALTSLEQTVRNHERAARSLGIRSAVGHALFEVPVTVTVDGARRYLRNDQLLRHEHDQIRSAAVSAGSRWNVALTGGIRQAASALNSAVARARQELDRRIAERHLPRPTAQELQQLRRRVYQAVSDRIAARSGRPNPTGENPDGLDELRRQQGTAATNHDRPRRIPRSYDSPRAWSSTDYWRLQQRAVSPSAAQLDRGELQEAAARGVGGASSPLPYRERIQRAFGRHDVSGVRTQVGGPASEASRSMGAVAYATGDRIAFASTPDLHLAAHEAAHVVQQRAGVSLKGGVGQVGDEYERHADAVADAVVRGESAESLLDRYAGAGSRGGAVQQRVVQRNPGDGQRAQGQEPAQQGEAQANASENDSANQCQVQSNPTWDAFADAFRGGFGEILHVFGDGEVDGARLRGMFTERQRQKLQSFIGGHPHMIPDRLFSDPGPSSPECPVRAPEPPQRVVMAAYILANGRYQPGSPEEQERAAAQQAENGSADQPESAPSAGGEDQAPSAGGEDRAQSGGGDQRDSGPRKVHARSCGHWAALVNAYAAVSGSAHALGVEERFDHSGNVVLGGGTGPRRPRPFDSHVTPHAGESQVGGSRNRACIALNQLTSRVQPGDWLYVYNDRRGDGGQHSVIFSRWVDTTPRGQGERAHQRGEVYDQLNNTNGQGGRLHTYWFGGTYSAGPPKILPVTRIERPGEDAAPATSVEELLPDVEDRRPDDAQGESEEAAPRGRRGRRARPSARAQNQAFLAEHGISIERAKTHVRNENTAMIAAIGARTNDSDRALLERANGRGSNLETLVRLNERLQRLRSGSAQLDASDGARNRRVARDGFETAQGSVSRRRLKGIGESRGTTGLLANVQSPLS